MYYCEGCRGNFARFKEPGRCPLCGMYASVKCSGCGYTASASVFIANDDTCPECGAHIGMPGASAAPVSLDPRLVLAGLVALAAILFIAAIVNWYDESNKGSVGSRESTASARSAGVQNSAPQPQHRGEETTDPKWPKRLLAQEKGSELFVPPDELSKVTALWNRAFMKYKHNSTNQELFDAVQEVLKGRAYYPEITMIHALNYLIDKGIQPNAATYSDEHTAMEAANLVLAQLQQDYAHRVAATAEYERAVAEALAENQAAARERGAQRNQASVDAMDAQRAQQIDFQQRIREKAADDRERSRIFPAISGSRR